VRRYSDAQLVEAIRTSHSWRGVLRALGLSATSAAAMRSVRIHANRLELDYSHFTGQRRWTDQQLAAAIASATSWTEVAETLGLSGGSSTTTIRGHAVRLGLDTAHLATPRNPQPPVGFMCPQQINLARAGSLIAAAWFELCGHSVSWPLEPSRYDLLVWIGTAAERIQVKTTAVKQGTSWTVWISNTGKERTTYDPDEIDYFFVIDGDFDYYLIPVAAVGGLTAIQLSAYRDYRLRRDAAEPIVSPTPQPAPTNA
jgi:PD-(D/E)XK endonuclease